MAMTTEPDTLDQRTGQPPAPDPAVAQVALALAKLVVDASRSVPPGAAPAGLIAPAASGEPGVAVPEAVEADRTRRSLGSGRRSLLHRNRRALYPWMVGGGLAAVGYPAWAAAWAFDAQPAVAAFSAVAAVIGTVATARIWRRRLPAGWGPWAALGAANAAAWLGATIGCGPSYEGLVWLIASTAGFGLRWWARIRKPYPDPAATHAAGGDGESGEDAATVDAPDPQAVEDAVVEVVSDGLTAWEVTDRWDRYVRAKGGPLPGAELLDLRGIDHGLVGTIALVPGKQSMGSVAQALEKIGTALDIYPEDIIVERHPDGPPSMLRTTFVTASPVKKSVFFDEPRYDQGAIELGPYRDGVGDAQVNLYGPDSMFNGFVLGSPGSGKSRILEMIALTAIAQANTVVVYLDGQSGASSPLLWQHALWRGGPDDAEDILIGLEAFMAHRKLRLRYLGAKTGLVGFTPSADFPGILVIVDECHRIWNKKNIKRWNYAARELRKLCGAIWGASQTVTLDEAFAGSDAMRSSLVSGNGIALRTLSSVQQQVFPGLKANLAALPRGGGHGYTIDDGDGRTRTAPFRGRFLVGQDAVDAGRIELPEGITTAEAWFALVAHLQRLDPGTAAAGGDLFAKRHDRAAAEQADLERIFLSGDFGSLLPQLDPAPGHEDDGEDQDDDLTADIVQFPTFPPGDDEPPAAELTPAQARVRDAITTGHSAPAEIAAHLGISTTAVHKHLAKLVDGGHVHRDAHGTYTT
uniref:helix-turn-helix transcriptional regulator n=1 Tax=Actinokineospora sp. CA-119265 TaxID=3239890 RepID=UPI003F49875A